MAKRRFCTDAIEAFCGVAAERCFKSRLGAVQTARFTACVYGVRAVKFYKAQVNVRCALGAKFQSRREILKCKRSRNRAVLKFKN